MQSPIGEIVLTSKGESITGLYNPEHSDYAYFRTGTYEPRLFQDAIRQLEAYFKGKKGV